VTANPWPHHLETIARMKERYEKDPDVVALILGGSIAKGWAREDSDVDFMLVVSDEAFARAAAAQALPVFDQEIATYPGGYIDGKKVNLGFLREVADHGSEPARSAFVNAWVEFSRDPEVDLLVRKIPVYPEEGHEERLEAFYSQVMLLGNFFVKEAEKRQDRYLMAFATTELAFYAMRIVLALNRRIYPYHKWLTRAAAECEVKPEGFLQKIDALLACPSTETAEPVVAAVAGMRDWQTDWRTVIHRFLEDREWNWRQGLAPLPDR
jgi:predicted nucleotidyltransferase